jgi:cystathionine beta-synthase
MGLAIAAVVKGYKCIFTTTDKQSKEKIDALKAFGAEVIVCPTDVDPEDPRSYYSVSSRLEREVPNAWKANQYDNLSNSAAHYEQTAPEIWEQTDGHIDHLVVGVGTGGTVSGVGRVLRERYPECRIVAVEPETCATISRGERGPSKIQGIAAGFVPRNYDPSVPHEVRTISDERAYRTKKELARREGILTGISAGANVAIALDLARELGPSANVVTILCDTGERYFSLDEYFKDA